MSRLVVGVAIWLAMSAVVAACDDLDERPLWGRTLMALIMGAFLSSPALVICWVLGSD